MMASEFMGAASSSESTRVAASGGCRCGAIRYQVTGEPVHASLCHCRDCRAASGAPMVAWTAFPTASVTIVAGEPASYTGTGASVRHFCNRCGTGLLFVNEEMLPGIIDVQTATLDEPERFAPRAHIQVAERIGWMEGIGALPEFERFPEA